MARSPLLRFSTQLKQSVLISSELGLLPKYSTLLFEEYFSSSHFGVGCRLNVDDKAICSALQWHSALQG